MFEEVELFLIQSASPFSEINILIQDDCRYVCIPSNQLDSILVFHASFDESESDQDRSPAQTGHAVHRDALL